MVKLKTQKRALVLGPGNSAQADSLGKEEIIFLFC